MSNSYLCGIYKITNTRNNLSYIGQSNNIERRWQEHQRPSRLKNPTNQLYQAIKTYGIENFSFEIVELCKKEELNDREKYWINYFNTIENGYNMSRIDNLQHKLSIEQVQQIQDSIIHSSLSFSDLAKQYQVSHTWISLVNSGKMWYNENLSYPLRQPVKKEEKIKIEKSYVKPNREELKTLIRNKTFVDIGKQYGISDNAIRKWCDKYNLPRHKREIKKLSDEEWKLI